MPSKKIQLDLFNQVPLKDEPPKNRTASLEENKEIEIRTRSPTDPVSENFQEKGPSASRLLSSKELREMSYQLKFKSQPPEPEQ
jgi:hypothetical protein